MTQIGIIMGSNSDWAVMQHAAAVLKQFGIAYETRVVSAHRTPDLMFEYAETARERGLQAIIAGAGGAAHLPGMVAAKTTLPVLGVPVPSKYLRAIGEAGAANAALFAAALLANHDAAIAQKLADFRETQRQTVLTMELPEAE